MNWTSLRHLRRTNAYNCVEILRMSRDPELEELLAATDAYESLVVFFFGTSEV